MKIREAPRSLIDKYSLYAKDYIEYPTKEYWSENFPIAVFHDELFRLAREKTPTVLYLHMPYCPQMCFFCVCHFRITHDYSLVRHSVDYLCREIDLLLECGRVPLFRELHFGGGSPNYIREADFERLLSRADKLFSSSPLEISIEIDPRRIGTDRLAFYADCGVDRLSFGVQDFDPHVQKMINRIQPPELIENLLNSSIRRRFKSINFDILIGLPGQTMDSIHGTGIRLLDMLPDRVALSYMHFNPKVHRHQMAMVKDAVLPSVVERKLMHEYIVEMLEGAGYVRTGMEHFAKPSDDVAEAIRNNTAQYNSLGATTGRCSALVGLGEGAYSRIGPACYVQNFYERALYENDVEHKRWPIWRGYWLSGEDIVRRAVIQQLRIYFAINYSNLGAEYNIDIAKFLRRESTILTHFENDGLLTITKRNDWGDIEAFELTEFGCNFANVICRVYDRHAWDIGEGIEGFFKAQLS